MRRYAATPGGQVHFQDTRGEGGNPLLCLHPLPYSGRYFDRITALLTDSASRILSPDYPGYGASDHLEEPPSIEGWARTLAQALDSLAGEEPGLDTPLDLLGFHTGCLVGPELARQQPDRVRSLILIDVPLFPPQTRIAKGAEYGTPPIITPALDSIEPAWKRTVAGKLEALGPDRTLLLLSEELRPGTRVNEGFAAAFAYDLENTLSALSVPTLVIATGGLLYGPSLAAADRIPGARRQELPSLTSLPLETGAEQLSPLITEFLATLDS